MTRLDPTSLAHLTESAALSLPARHTAASTVGVAHLGTVLCCDNLNHNGTVVESLVFDFCRALPTREGDVLAEWIGANVAFPSSMVDRIVPATTADDRRQARAISASAPRSSDGRRPRRSCSDPGADDGLRGTTDAATVVDRLLAIGPIFGPELPELGWWRRELVDDVRNLLAGRIPALSVGT